MTKRNSITIVLFVLVLLPISAPLVMYRIDRHYETRLLYVISSDEPTNAKIESIRKLEGYVTRNSINTLNRYLMTQDWENGPEEYILKFEIVKLFCQDKIGQKYFIDIMPAIMFILKHSKRYDIMEYALEFMRKFPPRTDEHKKMLLDVFLLPDVRIHSGQVNEIKSKI